MTKTEGRYKISISYGTLSASFTQDRITILEAKEIGLKISKVFFMIEETENVIMNIEQLARYET